MSRFHPVVSGWYGQKTNQANVDASLKLEDIKVNGNLELQKAKQVALQQLAISEFEANLVLKAIDTKTRVEAIRNLRFFVSAGFLPDKSGRINSLNDAELPSNSGLSPENIIEALEATIQIQFLTSDNNTGYCTAVAVSPKYILTAGYCNSNKHQQNATSFAQYSDETGLYNLKLVRFSADGDIALLKLEGKGIFNSSIKWSTVRKPVIGEKVYMAVWSFKKNTDEFRTCQILPNHINGSAFAHDCETGAGTAGALIIATSDNAPLGIHIGKEEKIGFATALATGVDLTLLLTD